jgi:hypothetical protein
MKKLIFLSTLCFSSILTAQDSKPTNKPFMLVLEGPRDGVYIRVNANKILYYYDYLNSDAEKIKTEMVMEGGRFLFVYETPADIDLLLGIEYSGGKLSEKTNQQCKVK